MEAGPEVNMRGGGACEDMFVLLFPTFYGIHLSSFSSSRELG
jgi:hypothetical protein